MTLPVNLHGITHQKHAYWSLKAMRLPWKKQKWSCVTMVESCILLCVNHIQKQRIFGVFVNGWRVVCKYAQNKRVACQENSHCFQYLIWFVKTVERQERLKR